MSFTVFLGNLPAWVTADDIKGWLTAENLVADAIKVIRNPETQESKGFAFIDAPNAEEMNSIIRRFDRAPLEDRLLRANPAQPPKPKGQSGPGSGRRVDVRTVARSASGRRVRLPADRKVKAPWATVLRAAPGNRRAAACGVKASPADRRAPSPKNSPRPFSSRTSRSLRDGTRTLSSSPTLDVCLLAAHFR